MQDKQTQMVCVINNNINIENLNIIQTTTGGRNSPSVDLTGSKLSQGKSSMNLKLPDIKGSLKFKQNGSFQSGTGLSETSNLEPAGQNKGARNVHFTQRNSPLKNFYSTSLSEESDELDCDKGKESPRKYMKKKWKESQDLKRPIGITKTER